MKRFFSRCVSGILWVRNHSLLSRLRNRYFVVFSLGLIWMSFFDKDSFYAQYQYWKQLSKLERTLEYYKKEAREMDSTVALLSGEDSFFLEKYAREHYLFRKTGETIYIIPDMEE